MKQCQNCGAQLADEEKFCPNCGKEITSAQSSAPDPIPTPVTGDPAPDPAAAPTPTPTPIPTPVQPTQPPKKKHKALKIVLAIVIPIVVIIVAVIVGLVLYGKSLLDRATENVDSYWQIYVDCDAQSFADRAPDAYWDYISDTYGYTKEECVDGIDLWMAENVELLGSPLSYTWEQTSFSFGMGDAVQLKNVREQLQTYGLDCTTGIGLLVDGTVTGDLDTDTFSDLGMWVVKIDGTWYDATIMADIDTLCDSGYVDRAKYETTYAEPIEAYWNAFYNADVEALSAMMPAEVWSYLESEYGMDQAGAEACMQQYIEDILSYSDMQDSEISFTLTITDVADCTEEEITELNNMVGEGFTSDVYQSVSYDYTMEADGETMDDTTATIMIQLGDSWYVFDGIYYFSEACYYYGTAE